MTSTLWFGGRGLYHSNMAVAAQSQSQATEERISKQVESAVGERFKDLSNARKATLGLIIAILPMITGALVWWTNHVNTKAEASVASEKLKVSVDEVVEDVSKLEVSNLRTRLLILKLTSELSDKMDRLHGKEPSRLPSLDQELTRALSELKD